MHIQNQSFNPSSDILCAKARGSAYAGSIQETESYYHATQETDSLIYGYCMAAANGYSAGIKQFCIREEKIPTRIVSAPLADLVRNGFIERLPPLISDGSDINKIFQSRLESKFSVGFSLLWNKESAKHFLENISDDRVIQFFLPRVEQQFGSTIRDEIRKIKLMQTKYKLHYPQAAYLAQNPESQPRPF